MKKEEREVCWASKEVLFACLDQSKDDVKKCEAEFMKLKELCPDSWVKRFIGKRKFDKEKDGIVKAWGDKYVEERRNKIETLKQKRAEKKNQQQQQDDEI